MSKFIHMLKFNFIFHKTNLLFLSVLGLFLFLLCSYFFTTPKETGAALIQYSSYIIFMLFTGKMNSRNSKMFDIKHLMAFPLTKKEIVILHGIADSVLYLPVAFFLLVGVKMAYPEYHILLVTLILFLLLAVLNVIAFNKRIDFSRMQHSKTNWKSSFLYLHKYLEMILQLIVVGITLFIAYYVSKDNLFFQEYMALILVIIALFVMGMSALKMLQDETRSYFLFKRDAFRIGWKAIVVIVPLVLFNKVYKDGVGVLSGLGLEETQIDSGLTEQISRIKKIGNKRFLLSIVQNNKETFKEYLKKPDTIDWDDDIMGGYPIHLSVLSEDSEILETILKLRPADVNKVGKLKKRTPIYNALSGCRLNQLELLVSHGAKLDVQDIDGNTPLIFGAQRKCFGGVILLERYGANKTIENNKGHKLVDYLSSKSGMKYLYTVKGSGLLGKRDVASEANPTLKPLKSRQLKLPHQQK